jgi:hypothetical protein
VKRRRQSGVVTVSDPNAEAEKSLIERAYREGESQGDEMMDTFLSYDPLVGCGECVEAILACG